MIVTEKENKMTVLQSKKLRQKKWEQKEKSPLLMRSTQTKMILTVTLLF